MSAEAKPYAEQDPKGGWNVDLMRFTTDLAKAMGGTDIESDGSGNRNRFKLGNDVIGLHVPMREHRVQARIWASDVPSSLRLYGETYGTERVSVDPNARTIERIAADLTKRLVNASQPALQAQRVRAAEIAAHKAWIASQVPVMERLGLQATQTSDGEELSLYGFGISGRIQASGSVHVERFSSLPLDKFKRIVAILAEPAA